MLRPTLFLIYLLLINPYAKSQVHDKYDPLFNTCDSMFNAENYEQAHFACELAFEELLSFREFEDLYADTDLNDSLIIEAGIKTGYSLTILGRYREALDAYNNLIACCFQPEKPDSNYLFIVQETAGICMALQDHALLADQCKEVIRVMSALGQPENEMLMNYYYTLGEEYLTGGNYAGAQQAYNKATEIHIKYHPVPDLIYARIQVELSSAYLSVGNPKKCIELNYEALRISDKSDEKDYSLLSDIYQLLIWGYNGLDNVDSAIYYTSKVIDVSYQLPAFEQATALVSAALYIINYDMTYKTTIAEENRFDNVLISAEQIYDSLQPPPIFLNNLYTAFANYYITIGKYDSTIYYYKKSLGLIESGYGKNNIIYLNSLATLGRYYEVDKNYAQAEITYDSLMAGSRRFLQSNFIFLPAGQQESILSSFEQNKNFAFSFYHDHNELPAMSEVFFDNELFMKGLLLQNITSLRNEILNSGDSSSIQLFNEWIHLKQELAAMNLNNQPDTSDLETAADKMEQQLIGKKKKKENAVETSWKDVREGLNKDEAAIEYVTFNETGITYYYAALVKRNSKSPELFFLGNALLIDSLLLRKTSETEASFIKRIYSFPDPAFPEDAALYTGPLIYQTFWAPFESELKDIKKVFIAPSGILHQLAFAAIPIDAEQSLINRYDLTLVSSAKQIVQRKEWSGFTNVLLAGGINYNDSTLYSYYTSKAMVQSVELPTTNTTWPQLPGTYSEVYKINSRLVASGKSTNLLTGSQASEFKFQSVPLQSIDILHIATHGYFFNGDDVDFSVSGYKYKTSANPLVRSGLLLAGGNYTWSKNRDADAGNDGVLTADEISNLDLSQTELIILSACETGLGDVRGSEGVYGLQRAFKMAGVDEIIMSLWQVPDRYTTELMELFYTYLLQGNSPEASLKNAQLVMQKKTSVYNWGAFILIR